MASSKIFDFIIVGAGPAGLSAATTIVRQAHSVLVVDSGKYRNEESKHMHAVPTWDHRNPSDFRAAAIKDYERYGCVQIERTEVKSARKNEKGLFEIVEPSGTTHLGHKLILATGVEDLFPDIEGYSDCWVSGIFHCLYCHGWEEKGTKSSGMLAVGDCGAVGTALHLARQNLQLSETVTLYTHGDEKLASELESALQNPPVPRMRVEPRRIAKFEKGSVKAEVVVHFEDGSSKTEGFVAHKPKFRLRGDLHEQLGLDLTPQGTVKVDPPFNKTKVAGVFACGDMISPMQTAVHALYSGGSAGAGAAIQLQAEQFGQKSLF